MESAVISVRQADLETRATAFYVATTRAAEHGLCHCLCLRVYPCPPSQLQDMTRRCLLTVRQKKIKRDIVLRKPWLTHLLT